MKQYQEKLFKFLEVLFSAMGFTFPQFLPLSLPQSHTHTHTPLSSSCCLQLCVLKIKKQCFCVLCVSVHFWVRTGVIQMIHKRSLMCRRGGDKGESALHGISHLWDKTETSLCVCVRNSGGRNEETWVLRIKGVSRAAAVSDNSVIQRGRPCVPLFSAAEALWANTTFSHNRLLYDPYPVVSE